ncbi:MAG: hypothetical protein SF029_00305 [bacterium]|nr:hypothetical protein [bacterium]
MQLIADALHASRIRELKRYIDVVRYDHEEKSPEFSVTDEGVRELVIDATTLKKTREAQLIAVIHEIVHAQQYHRRRQLQWNGDNLSAMFDTFYGELYNFEKRSGRYNYARDEVIAEAVALRRVGRFLGTITPQQSAESLQYIAYYRQIMELNKA